MALTPEKVERIAQEYQKTGFLNKSKALINAGYKESYANCGRRDAVYKNTQVIQAIDRLRTKIVAKVEITAEYLLNNLKSLVENNKEKRPEIACKAIDMLNKYKGLYQADNAQRTEQAKLTEEQVKEAKEYAKWRLLTGLNKPQEAQQSA